MELTEKVKRRLAFLINVFFVAVVIALVYLAYRYVIGWVLPFLLAFCIVSLVHPLIRIIKKNLRIKQEVVSVVVMILIYALVGVLIFLAIMQIAIVIRDGFTTLPDYFEQTVQPALLRAGESLAAFVGNLPPEWQEQIASIQDEVIRALQSFLVDLSQRGIGYLTGMTSRLPAFLIAFVFTIMLSFFISTQYEKVVDFFRVQCSPRVKDIIRNLKRIVIDTIFKYFRAALSLMVITFVELSVGLIAIGTKSAIPIAAGIAVFDALPFFGTGAIMIPWCIIELLQGNFRFAFGLMVLYGIVTVVRNIIEPKIVGDKLGLNPIVSLTAIYVGYKLFGVLGMIAMPILTQVAMELHRNGVIKLFQERPEAASPKTSGAKPAKEA